MIHKAFSVLSAFSVRDGNTIDEISKKTGIPRSTVHRILQALAEEGIVMMIPKRGYVLTSKLISIGLNGMAQRELLDVAAPIMKAIEEKTGETVSLNVICGHERVCVYRVEGEYPITRKSKIGDKGPLFRGSVGKIIASGLSPREIRYMLDKYIADGEIDGEDTLSIMAEIEKVRKQGYAISIGERVRGAASIAVPISDVAEQTVSSLSISTIQERLNEENKKRYLKILLESTRLISIALVNL